MITQKKFTGNIRGRDNKYPFKELRIGSCMTFPPPDSEIPNISKFRSRISTALYQWKKYNGHKWKTAVRIEGENVLVYRIS